MHVFDPKKMIMPPFVSCPSCGAAEFGVAFIHDTGFWRRCRECWHSQGFRLPKIKKRIVYLDQLVVSNFLNVLDESLGKASKVDPFYRKLFVKVERLVKMQVMVCPSSPIHREESIVTGARVPQLQQLFAQISQGVQFKSDHEVKMTQIWNCLQTWLGHEDAVTDDDGIAFHDDPHAWKGRLSIYCRWGVNPEQAAHVERSRDEMAEKNAAFFKKSQQEKGVRFREQFEAGIKQWPRVSYQSALRRTWERQNRWMREDFDTNDVSDINSLLPDFNEEMLSMVTEEISRESGPGAAEAEERVLSFYDSRELSQAPFLRIEAFLFAAQDVNAANGQVKLPNRGTLNDFNALAAYGPYCDAMFVDNAARAIAKPRKGYHTGLRARLFSMSNKEEFMQYLEEMEASTPEEHRAAAENLYGEDFFEPYTSMFSETASQADGNTR